MHSYEQFIEQFMRQVHVVMSSRGHFRCSASKCLSLAERTLGIVSDNLQGVHARIKLFGDAIEQTERASDQQQICGNSADALPNLHSDADRINIFPTLTGLVFAK